jgi:hypothetical protein
MKTVPIVRTTEEKYRTEENSKEENKNQLEHLVTSQYSKQLLV